MSGDLDGLYAQTALLGLGAMVGAQIGARLSARVHGVVIMRTLAGSLLLVGVRLGVSRGEAGNEKTLPWLLAGGAHS